MERKSIRLVSGARPDFPALTQECVAFANSGGGTLLIGIEDGEAAPPPTLRIDQPMMDRVRRRVDRLELADAAALRPWLGRLLEWGLVDQIGKTKATRYFVPPPLLRGVGLDRRTTLKRLQPHRLRALIVEDIERFPGSSISDIHRRIGQEIPVRSVKRALDELVEERRLQATGERRWRRYHPAVSIDQGHDDGR